MSPREPWARADAAVQPPALPSHGVVAHAAAGDAGADADAADAAGDVHHAEGADDRYSQQQQQAQQHYAAQVAAASPAEAATAAAFARVGGPQPGPGVASEPVSSGEGVGDGPTPDAAAATMDGAAGVDSAAAVPEFAPHGAGGPDLSGVPPSMAGAMTYMVSQLDVITRTLLLCEQRLSLTEEKMSGLARRQDELADLLAAQRLEKSRQADSRDA